MFIGPLIISSLILYNNADGLAILFPHSASTSVPVILTRIIVLLIMTSEIVRTNGLLFVVSFITLLRLIHSFELLNYFDPKKLFTRKKMNLRSEAEVLTINQFYLLNDLKVFNCLQICGYNFKPFLAIVLAFALYSGGIITTILNYITFKMYNQLPLFQYFGFLSIDVTMILIGLLCSSHIVEIHVTSSELLQSWKRDEKRLSKYRRKVVRSFKPVEAPIGSLFVIRKEFKSTFLKLMFEYTINAILTF